MEDVRKKTKKGGSVNTHTYRDKCYKMTRKDALYVSLIILLYSLISFINLGSFHAPQTFWRAVKSGDKVTLMLDKPERISKIRVYRGYDEAKGIVSGSEDGSHEETIAELSGYEVFTWQDIEVDKTYQYITFEAEEAGYSIGEAVIFDVNGNKVKLTAAADEAKVIIDEPQEVPEKITSAATAYFDEIYFARAAYEWVKGDTL